MSSNFNNSVEQQNYILLNKIRTEAGTTQQQHRAPGQNSMLGTQHAHLTKHIMSLDELEIQNGKLDNHGHTKNPRSPQQKQSL